ncbi:DNA replication/repair protein RecF [Acaricomes phytoseiuli]|uniref:DNA replication/repair protein RecF n=1 Tax=Acaricomes phytoseiuli TaxID=291968 RepID=UPI00036571B3|nr:DNA replication/repair protein RecF [Acaricomes phytoseiuli]MCW1248662.1 DNA replication/repair protein RecF [Acaricomes phytoseiuli]
MYLEQLVLTDFRSYASLDVEFQPGVSVLVGANGFGKTNIVEALGYVANLASHRVSADAPLIRIGQEQAIVRACLVRGSQRLSLELEINSKGGNRARINRANPVRAREILGLCRSVLFAPEDLSLVKGDPGQRRRFLDEMLQTLSPRLAGVRGDYDRVLRQRNALLKSARGHRFSRGGLPADFTSTLDVWDQHLSIVAAELVQARYRLVDQLAPHAGEAYAALTEGGKEFSMRYRSSLNGYQEDPDRDEPGARSADELLAAEEDLGGLPQAQLMERFQQALIAVRPREVDRGLTLIGPHRDELDLLLAGFPVKGFASHGETWSVALSLRLACYALLRQEQEVSGADPILVLDDVFAELDTNRRERLAQMVSGAEQVLVTAAVDADIPEQLQGHRIRMSAPGKILIPSSQGLDRAENSEATGDE